MLWKDNRAEELRDLVGEVSECSTMESKHSNYGSEDRRRLLGMERVEEDWRY